MRHARLWMLLHLWLGRPLALLLLVHGQRLMLPALLLVMLPTLLLMVHKQLPPLQHLLLLAPRLLFLPPLAVP